MTVSRLPNNDGGIQPTILTAKGDLLTATAASTVTNLPAGSNDQVLVADSTTSTGLAWKPYGAPFAAGKNAVINGGMDIWQRGTSFTNPGNTSSYTADRYAVQVNASITTHTVSQQSFTPGAAPVAGYESQFFYRSLITTPGSCTVLNIQNRIEDVRTFAGQTVTVSFWAKADTTRAVSVDYYQVFGSGGSGTVSGALLASTNLTTGWVRYSATVALPSISGKTIGTGSYLAVVINQTVTAGSTLDFWGVQLEAGSVATNFSRAGGNIQGELAACQRYYWRAGGSAAYQYFGIGTGANTTTTSININNPITMRVAPTTIDFSTLAVSDTSTVTAVTNLTADILSPVVSTVTASVASGITAYRPYRLLANNSTSAYIGFSAEL